MKDMKRAERRHHIARLKKTRSSYFVFNWWDNVGKRLGVISQYPKKCSCHMCGNPRKYDKQERTLQELRDIDRTLDGLEDWYNESDY